MKTKLLRKARLLWGVDYMPREINRANQLKWARAVARLGDKWILAQQVQRKQPQ